MGKKQWFFLGKSETKKVRIIRLFSLFSVWFCIHLESEENGTYRSTVRTRVCEYVSGEVLVRIFLKTLRY